MPPTLEWSQRNPIAGAGMPIHDWTTVLPGVFHDFHQRWTVALAGALNQEVLSDVCYACVGQPTCDSNSGLSSYLAQSAWTKFPAPVGALDISEAPPNVQCSLVLQDDPFLAKRNVIEIHHTFDERLVAIVQLVSPGNKSNRICFDRFVEKSIASLEHGLHLLIIDLFPPAQHSPRSIPAAIWRDLGKDQFPEAPGKSLLLAAFVADSRMRAYIEPVAVGDGLPDMPLFLTPDHYVPVPLEPTYREALAGMPKHLQAALQRGLQNPEKP